MAAPARQQHGVYGRRWRRLRHLVLADSPACKECDRPATEVHHIQPVSDGGEPYEIDNLMPLCRLCHDRQHGGGNRRR